LTDQDPPIAEACYPPLLSNRLERVALTGLRLIPSMRGKPVSARALTALRGSAWSLAGHGSSQIIRLAAMLILARHLLGPSAFGLVALVSVFLSGLEMLSDLGIGVDVIQHRRGDDPSFLNTAFLIQSARGTALWIIAAILAFPFAAFYKEPAVRSLIIAGAFSVVIRGMTSSSVWTLTRHVRLKKLTVLNVAGDSVGLVVAVVWALVSPTAWALVAGKLATALAFVAGSHLISEQPVRLTWDRSAASDIFAFGTGMFLSSATWFFCGEAERLVIGKFVTIAELGCFSLALALSAVPLDAMRKVIAQVFLPLISESARADRESAWIHLKRARAPLLAASISMAVVFILFSKVIVALLLGPRFAMTAWMLQLLGFRAAIELFGTAAATTLFGLGISKYAAYGNTSKLIFLAMGFFVAFEWFGFRQAMWVLAVSPVAQYVPNLVGLKRHLRPAVASEVYSFLIFILSAAATVLALRVWS